ncbi:hypothetical protein D3C73_853710 [compost metagenome]
MRVLLVGGDLDPRAGDHVVQVPPRQRAVGRIGRHVEQHMAFGRIGAAGVDDGLDLLDDGFDVVGDVRGDVGRRHVQQPHVGQIGGLIARRDLADGHAFLGRLGVDLVVHVGDVAGVDDGVRAVSPAQQPHQDVEHHRRSRIADMGVVIDRRAADIEAHPVRIARLEQALFTAQGVVDMQGHRSGLLRVFLRDGRSVPYSGLIDSQGRAPKSIYNSILNRRSRRRRIVS